MQETDGGECAETSCWKWGLHMSRQCGIDPPHLWQTPFCCWRLQTCPQLKEGHLAALIWLIEPYQVPWQPDPFLSSVCKRGRTGNYIPSVVFHMGWVWGVVYQFWQCLNFCAISGIKDYSRLLSKRQYWSGAGAELLLLWGKRSKKSIAQQDGDLWWKALESWICCPTTAVRNLDLFWGPATALRPLSMVADTLFSTGKEAAELWQCHRWCVGTRILVWLWWRRGGGEEKRGLGRQRRTKLPQLLSLLFPLISSQKPCFWCVPRKWNAIFHIFQKHSLKNSKLLSCQGVMDAYKKKESNYGRLGCSSWTCDEGKHSWAIHKLMFLQNNQKAGCW